MKITEALADHSIAAVRRRKWANPNDRLQLPPVVPSSRDGTPSRGVWGKLIGFDGVQVTETNVLCLPAMLGGDDWEAWTAPNDR